MTHYCKHVLNLMFLKNNEIPYYFNFCTNSVIELNMFDFENTIKIFSVLN